MAVVRSLVLMIVVAASVSSAWATFAQPSTAPVARIIRNAERYAEKHPDDARGWYVLGRAHYLAYAMKGWGVPAYSEGGEDAAPRLPSGSIVPDPIVLARQAEAKRRTLEALGVDRRSDLDGNRKKQQAYWKQYRSTLRKLMNSEWQPEPADQEVLDKHAMEAIRHYRKAIDTGEEGGLYHLGLASVLEEYADRAEARRLNLETLAPFRDRMKRPEGAIVRQWRESAMAHYVKAYEGGKAKAEALDKRPAAGVASLVAVRAAAGYERLRKAGEDLGEAETAKTMEAFIARMRELPMGPITPIVFSLEAVEGIDTLIDADASVAFDLDGTGRLSQRWQWVGPNAVLLAWDPHDTGRVVSGRQLFGSATWWLLPGDGFRAMSLLDDDGDGWLRGAELRGLAGWRDRNGDGVSQGGEVLPLEALGVTGIATEATGRDGGHPVHRSGLRLEGGRTLPVWDWMAEPAADQGESKRVGRVVDSPSPTVDIAPVISRRGPH